MTALVTEPLRLLTFTVRFVPFGNGSTRTLILAAGRSINVFALAEQKTAGLVGASFAIDGAPPTNYWSSPQEPRSTTNKNIFSAIVPAGDHRLVINSLSEQPLLVDYLLVETDRLSSVDNQRQNTVRTKIIVGSVSVSLALLTILGLFLFFRKHRRRREGPSVNATPRDPLRMFFNPL